MHDGVVYACMFDLIYLSDVLHVQFLKIQALLLEYLFYESCVVQLPVIRVNTLYFSMTDQARRERERERREQYKQVRAHVKKDDGRMQAYGWSLPAKLQTSTGKDGATSKPNVPIPVPVYCRPLNDEESDMKVCL